MLVSPQRWVDSRDKNAVQSGLYLRDIMSIRPGHDERQWDATTVHQQMAFAPIFSPIGGVGSNALLCQWCFHHRAVNTLPSRGYAFKFILLSKAEFSQCFEHNGLFPFKESGVDCAGTAETLGR